MYAKDLDEEATAEWLEGVLAGVENGTAAAKKSSKAKTAAAAA
jgi:hypothetical protein